VSGRHLAIGLGVIMILGAVYATRVIRQEKDAHFQRAETLQQNLQRMRKAIADFRAAEGRYPRELQELVPKYLPTVPIDPVTNDKSWRVTTEETVQPSSDFVTATAPQTEKYIVGVHSSASGKDATGKPFADY
jgi:hypothetical protein